jgi:hypothetical protein
MNTMTIPEGYMRNSKGGLDPVTMIKDIDKARDDLVRDLVSRSLAMSEQLRILKEAMFADIRAFVELSAEKYGVKFGGKKGNMSFVSYDGEYKVLVAVNEMITFDERLQIAKDLIDDCIKDWAQGSRQEIQALVNDAFYVGKAGKINTSRILGLRRLEINDERWRKAMEAIGDSIQTTDSREYIRVYQRNPKGEYDLVNLDVASL